MRHNEQVIRFKKKKIRRLLPANMIFTAFEICI